MITLNLLKQTKYYACATFLLTSFAVSAQTDNSLATDNTFIEGVTVDSYFDAEGDRVDGKNTLAPHMTDGDDDTDWAGQTSQVAAGEAFNILSLNGTYDLAEVQLLTVTGKTAPYTYDIYVSTTGTDAADFTDAFSSSEKGTTGFLESNYQEVAGSVLDGTYKSFTLPTVIEGAKYIKIFCYGRTDVGNGGGSVWSTISELKFYAKADATASTRGDALSNALVYPNPANDFLTLSDINDAVDSIQIVGLDGSVVLSQEIDSSSDVTINTSAIAAGVYFVNFSSSTSNLHSSKSIIIQH